MVIFYHEKREVIGCFQLLLLFFSLADYFTAPSNVVFEINGVIYDLSSFDNDMSAEEFLDMAEEIVRAK